MPLPRALRHPAALCALLLAMCALASYPVAEVGGNDDFAYVRSAKILAETGHLVYVGWSSAMLGWQLAWGALFINLFGFSFTTTRLSILVVGMVTAAVLQRTMTHLGLSERNATFATLTLVLSPLFIPLSVSFMSDIPGLLAIVLSVYMCLRAMESVEVRQATWWLIGAAVSSALLGTARQTGWLGALLIFPCACWIMRRRRLPFVLLGVVWLLCAGFIFGCLHWFSNQLYATAESTHQTGADAEHFFNMAVAAVRAPLEIAFFLVPILFAYTLAFFHEGRKRLVPALIGTLVVAAFFVLRLHGYWAASLLVPAANTLGNYVTPRGFLELPAIGVRPLVLGPAVRLVMSLVCYFSAFAWVALVLSRRDAPVKTEGTVPGAISWSQLAALLGPLALIYGAFLLFRVAAGTLFDRYLLPELFVLAVVAMRFYQERISAEIPKVCVVILILGAAYGIAGTHDMFAADRARLAATDELRKAGVPRTAFYGGFAYDGWTQIDEAGYVDVDDIHTPHGINHLSPERTALKPCGYWPAKFLPTIHPEYAVSYDDIACDPQDKFAPIPYKLWLPPFSSQFYIRGVSPERMRPVMNNDGSIGAVTPAGAPTR